MAKFEKRFAGKDNAGLRAEIRGTVATARAQGDDVPRAVEAIGRRVALTALPSGRRDTECGSCVHVGEPGREQKKGRRAG